MEKIINALEDLINTVQYSQLMQDSFVRESVERARKVLKESHEEGTDPMENQQIEKGHR